jgi:uncharacterized membrane protein YdjX (TVP38/TMEM64 family)
MIKKDVRGHRAFVIIAALTIGALAIYIFRESMWSFCHKGYFFLTDRKQVGEFIASFGWAAPLVFMGIQILQVFLAPVPGEATGFLGGYLFGSTYGFVYSSIALAIGSWINFSVGRFVGERYVRRMITKSRFEKFDRLVRRQGIIIIFLLFVFPGFPKDWFSLFLGITTLPVKVFVIIATIGRMPGTLLLSLQGELLFEQNYALLISLLGLMLFIAGWTFLYRKRLYGWIEKSHQK